MAATNVSFILFKNRYNGLKFEVLGGVTDLEGDGWKARWTLSTHPGATGGDILIDKDSESLGEITFEDNFVFVDIMPGDTDALDPGGNYYQELTLIDDNDNPRVASYGDNCILRDTTDLV